MKFGSSPFRSGGVWFFQLAAVVGLLCTESAAASDNGKFGIIRPWSRFHSAAAAASTRTTTWMKRLGEKATTDNSGDTTVPKLPEGMRGRIKFAPAFLIQSLLASDAIARFSEFLSVDPNVTILVLNFLVFLGWEGAEGGEKKWMNKHFVLHADKDLFRPHQVLLSGFSHEDQDHLISNMMMLLRVGPPVFKCMGCRAFSFFYVASMYAACFFNSFCYKPFFNLHQETIQLLFWKINVPDRSCSLGASGAVSAVLVFCGLACPDEKVELPDSAKIELLDGEQELPVWLIATLSFLSDLLLPSILGNRKTSGIGHGDHLGGSLFGAGVFFINWLYRNNAKRLQWLSRRLRRRLKIALKSSKKRVAMWSRRSLRRVAAFCEAARVCAFMLVGAYFQVLLVVSLQLARLVKSLSMAGSFVGKCALRELLRIAKKGKFEAAKATTRLQHLLRRIASAWGSTGPYLAMSSRTCYQRLEPAAWGAVSTDKKDTSWTSEGVP